MPDPQPDVDEFITVVEYDPSWPSLFHEESRRVAIALGGAAFQIEHVGSTAVAGMAGKPIVDLLIGAPDLSQATAFVSPLERLGYQNFGEIFIPGRLYLRRRGPPHFNIALTRVDGPFWTSQLLLRDYLRSHPGEALLYSTAKKAAYAQGADRFSTYSQAKHPFLLELVQRAEAWKREGQ